MGSAKLLNIEQCIGLCDGLYFVDHKVLNPSP